MNPQTFELLGDVTGKLTLRRVGEDDVHDVRLRRAFPWSRPEQNISIRSSDGKELMLIDDLAQVEPTQRALIERWLARHSFIPRITRIDEIDVRFGHQLWRVRTDRGPVQFRVQEREDIRFLSDGRFSIKDADGNVYELTSLDALDASSRKALDPLL